MKLLDSVQSGSNFVFLVNGVNESGANYPHSSNVQAVAIRKEVFLQGYVHNIPYP